jgi:hypothetical protein
MCPWTGQIPCRKAICPSNLVLLEKSFLQCASLVRSVLLARFHIMRMHLHKSFALYVCSKISSRHAFIPAERHCHVLRLHGGVQYINSHLLLVVLIKKNSTHSTLVLTYRARKRTKASNYQSYSFALRRGHLQCGPAIYPEGKPFDLLLQICFKWLRLCNTKTQGLSSAERRTKLRARWKTL